MAGLELFKKNVGILPYQPAFHIPPTCSLRHVHADMKVKGDPEHYIKKLFKMQRIILILERECVLEKCLPGSSSVLEFRFVSMILLMLLEPWIFQTFEERSDFP